MKQRQVTSYLKNTSNKFYAIINPCKCLYRDSQYLGAYLQNEDALEDRIEQTYLELTQNSKSPITPLQRGEIIAYQWISGRFNNCFDLLTGLDADDFFTAWEQFEFLVYLLGYSSRIDLNSSLSQISLKK